MPLLSYPLRIIVTVVTIAAVAVQCPLGPPKLMYSVNGFLGTISVTHYVLKTYIAFMCVLNKVHRFASASILKISKMNIIDSEESCM